MSLLLSAAKGSVFYIPPSVRLIGATGPLVGLISFELNGDIESVNDSEWYINGPATIGNDFEIYAEEVGGPAGFSGTFDTWLPVTESREWSLSQAALGSVSGDIQFSLRRIGDADPLLVVETSFYVEVTS